MCVTSGASGVSIFQRNRIPLLTACPVCQRYPRNLFQRRRPTLFSECHPRGRSCFVHGPCCHKISACLKQCKLPVASFVQRGALGLLPPVSYSVFSTMSVEFASIWCFFAFCVLRLWVWSHPRLFAFSHQFQSGVFLPSDSVSCSVTQLWVCSDLCLLAFSRHILSGLFSPEIPCVAV